MAAPEPGPAGDAIEIFAAWLSRRENGEPVEFVELLRRHPHLAAELAELEATWKRLAAASDPSHASHSLHERIKSRFGEASVPEISLREREKGDPRGDFSSLLIAQLSAHSTGFGRYRIRGEVARGGMGVILKIWDEDLRRHLAMKVILGKAEASASGATPPVETSKVARFLEEAQVTGQLDHPGIVPVHELGLDPEGRLYFTMKLVKGRSLKEVFDLVAGGQEGWTQTRALGVLLKVCEAMAYAHDKGVIHRDLKPGNIMVGKFGEVHVMDWGLARILDEKDEKDIRIREEIPRSTELRSHRDEHRGENPESPLYTMDGDVVGTPAYMPPEQAAGRVEEVGPHSDVYALGAMLYHLIAGHMPYVPKDARLNNYAIWGLVQQGPPTSIAQLSPETPAELVAICDKAMARDWKQRYRDMSELAADLSAYLEHRVVDAYETGTWAETKKWVERNKALAASLVAAITILVAGIIGTTTYAVDAKQQSKRAETVLGLVDDMLSSADPHENKGKDYRVRDLLDEFDRKLGTRLQGEPEAEASVQRLLGRAYRGLGLSEKAEPHLARALELRRQVLGDDHSDVALSLVDSAMLLHDRGEFQEAMNTFDEAIRIFAAAKAPECLEIADSLSAQSDLQRHLGDFPRAEQLSRDAVAMSRKLVGDENPFVSECLGMLANALEAQGKWTEAEDVHRQVLAMDRRLFGDEHIEIATSLHNLALVIEDQGRYDEAEQLDTQALAMRRKLLGEEHQDVAASLLSLGAVLFRQGKLNDAEDLLRQALALLERLHGDEHPDVAICLSNLATVLQDQGKLAEAEALYRQALAVLRKLLGDEHPDVATCLNTLAAVLAAQGRQAEAEELTRQALTIRRNELGEEHPATMTSLNNLAYLLRVQGRLAEAEELFRHVLEVMRRLVGDEHPSVASTLANLADVLNAEEKYSEAEELSRQALAVRRRVLGEEHPNIAKSLNILASALRGQGRMAESEDLVRQALAMQRGIFGDEHVEVATSLQNLATLLASQGRLAESEALYREALAMLRKTLGDDSPEVAKVLPKFISVLEDQRKFADAEEMSRLALELARRRLPAGDPELATALARLGSFQLQLHEYAEAESTLRECLAIRAETQPGEWRTFGATGLLGGALDGLGRHEEADALLREGYEKMQPPPEAAGRKREALERLIEHYEAWGKPDEAARWRKLLGDDTTGK